MNDLIFARIQMGMSLAFHMIFATVGMGMPVLMAISEGLYIRTKKTVYLELTKRWAIGTAILFAIGAVSGTVLSFELGLLWPRFMEFAGPIIGMPFSLEGFAFFTEAIFLGLFLYGWDRMPALVHWFCGILVAASGMISGVFVVTVNAWMNAPVGFTMENGEVTSLDPIRAMFNPASLHLTLHMAVAALVAIGFLVAGIHAYFLLKDRASSFHRTAFATAATVGCIFAPLQILTGDLSARRVAELQPAKLAAMEAHFQTHRNAPLVIGGIVNEKDRTVRHALKIPSGLSLLINYNPNALVPGLDQIPESDWPPVPVVHLMFDIMVGCGVVLLLLSLWAGLVWIRQRNVPDGKWLLRAFVIATPLGIIAIEAGWMVTEFGRQPWVIYQFMRTSHAVTPMPGLIVPLLLITAVYLFLSVVLVFLLKRQFLATSQPHLLEKTNA